MATIMTVMLFTVALGVSLCVMLMTILPYSSRIVSLLTQGTQVSPTTVMPQPRRVERFTPRALPVPAKLRAAA